MNTPTPSKNTKKDPFEFDDDDEAETSAKESGPEDNNEEEMVFDSPLPTTTAITNGHHHATNHDTSNGHAAAAAASAVNDEIENNTLETETTEETVRKADPKIWGAIESINVIEKSPYEPNQSAEVSEPLFDEMKILLMSKEEVQGELQDLDGRPTISVQKATVQVFGLTLAESLIKANHVIAKSGILFSPQWLDDKQCKIRGVQCGWITRPMMLVLLQEQRFARASDVILNTLIQNLGVSKMFFDALKEWKLEKGYPRLMVSAPTLSFTTKKRECYKAIIFVARAYRCAKLLRRESKLPFREQEPGLFAKVQACLELVDTQVKVNPKRLQEFEEVRESKRRKTEQKRHKKALIEAATRDNLRRQQETQQRQMDMQRQRQHTAPKQSRKRQDANVPNHILTVAPKSQSRRTTNGRAAAAPSSSPSSLSHGPSPVPSSALEGRHARRQGEREEGLETLLRIAENQHRLLGETIKTLKVKIEQDRLLLRAEIREELLQEGALANGTNGTKR